MLHSWGGRLGTLKGTPEGQKLLFEMERINIDDIRKLINKLISYGYDKTVPQRLTEQRLLTNLEASSQLVSLVETTKSELSYACETIDDASDILHATLGMIRSDLQPYLTPAWLPCQVGHDPHSDTEPLGLSLLVGLDELFEAIDSEKTCTLDDDKVDWIDSDEEARLYDELDELMEAQERAFAFKGNVTKFMANAFQKCFLRLQEMEDAFKLVIVNDSI